MDQDDPTNLPIGLAAVCRNSDFTLTSVDTRAGVNATMKGINQAPITGLMCIQYAPVTSNPADVFFQLPLAFDFKGALQYESPVGSGKLNQVPAGLFVPPASAHMIATQAANKGWLAYSNLTSPKSSAACIDPKTLTLDPYGMKPVGWNWMPSQPVIVGEMATPSVKGGNGHTYRCIQAGTTDNNEPTWPTTENAIIAETGTSTVKWQEHTMVMANRIPAPPLGGFGRVSGGGGFAAGLDVYFVITAINGIGETIASIKGAIVNTVLDDAINVTLPTLANFPGWVSTLTAPYAVTSLGLYEASLPTGEGPPQIDDFQQVGTYAPGTIVTVTSDATSGITPPTRNGARITGGQLPTPIDEAVIARVGGGGAFVAGRDVYIRLSYSNANGETPLGPSNSIIDTQVSDAVQVTIQSVDGYPQIVAINVYECDVPTGTPEPDASVFSLYGQFNPGDTATVTDSASGKAPETVNGTGAAGNVIADTETGGPNATQGKRYSALMFMNRNQTVSGFTLNSVISYVVDEDGWELRWFNIATGPSNLIGRVVSATVADGTSAGPFYYIGLVNTQVPTQNFVYPQQFLSDGIEESAMVFLDNTTTTGTINFSDEYLQGSTGNDVTDRLRVIWPYQCVQLKYLESVDRMIQVGVPGYYSSCLISLGADYESYYGDTSPVVIRSDTGERAWLALEYKGVIWLLRERSGVVLSPNANDPSSWVGTPRWTGTGPCGPRAADSCAKFMMYVHENGIFKYDDTEPDMVIKELPNWWSSINWTAANTIWVRIDEKTHTVRFGFPIGQSTVPNMVLTVNYLEGWQNPIHFSVYSGKTVAVDACRKYSMDDIQAFVCERLYRNIPGTPPLLAPSNVPALDAGFYISQLCFGSSGPDGTINARTAGIFNDNGTGIDWVYEPVSAGAMMALSKLEGFVLNAKGMGQLFVSFLAGRDMKTSGAQGPNGGGKTREIVVKRPIMLAPDSISETRKVPSKINEFWRPRFTNGKIPDAWASLKFCKVFSIPMFDSRNENESE